MNERPTTSSAPSVADPDLEALEASVAEWAGGLRSHAVTEFDPAQVTHLAELASAAAVASAASLASTAGTTSGLLTGATKMTGLLTSTITKFAASAALAASFGAAAAVGGVLPAPMQSGAADLADHVGIDLPRPSVTVDVEGAGTIVVSVVDGVLEVVGVDAGTDWDATVRTQSDLTAVVDFVSDEGTRTVTVVADRAGQITSMVEDTRAGAGIDGSATGAGSAGDDGGSTAGSGSVSGSGAAGVETPPAQVTVDADVGIDLGL